MFDAYRLSDEDRTRLESGGPLNLCERLVVEWMTRNYFDYMTKGQPVRLKWSTQWQDGLHIYGEPYEHWDGYGYSPSARNRRLVLGYFAQPESEEPAIELLDLDAESIAFLASL